MYRKIIIAGATTAAIVGGGGAALAVSASGDTPAPSASGSHAAGTHSGKHAGKSGKSGKSGKAGKGKRLLRHIDHADIVVHTKKHGDVTRELIRGTVTSVSPSSITVTSADHTVRTFTVSKDTKVRSRTKGQKPATTTIAKVAKGDHVFVGGVARGSAKPAARHVVDVHTS